jgi:hypothetical protein
MSYFMVLRENGIVLRGSESKKVGLLIRSLGKWVLAASLALFLVLGANQNSEAEGPAVSAINAKAQGLFGSFDSEGAAIGLGSLSLPLARQFGLQIDAGMGDISADDYGGGGAHLFWRDPSLGLIGLIGSYQELDNESLIRSGAEGEWYLNDLTIRGRTGYQYGDAAHGGFFLLGLKYYAMNNLLVEVEPQLAAGDFLFKAGVEYQPELTVLAGLSFFAQGEVGEDDYDSWIGGIRYYFGPKKSLKLRQRQDEPDSLLPQGMKFLQDEVHRSRRVTPPPQPPPPEEIPD